MLTREDVINHLAAENNVGKIQQFILDAQERLKAIQEEDKVFLWILADKFINIASCTEDDPDGLHKLKEAAKKWIDKDWNVLTPDNQLCLYRRTVMVSEAEDYLSLARSVGVD